MSAPRGDGLVFETELERRCSALLKDIRIWIWAKKVRMLADFVKAEIERAKT